MSQRYRQHGGVEALHRQGLSDPRQSVLLGSRAEHWRFALVLVLWLIIALLGGAARSDVYPLLVLRPVAVLLAAAVMVGSVQIEWRRWRVPLILLVALAAVMLMQLMPLPPALWQALPQHARLAEAAAAAGVPQPWRPISVSPDLTLNSLVSLFIPAALLVSAAALRDDQRAAMLPAVLAVTGLSAVLGLFQVGTGSELYPYAITNLGRPVGLFANINHQAALLACALPMTAALAVPSRRGLSIVRIAIALTFGGFLVVALLVSGSRGGLVLGVLALAAVPLVVGDRLPWSRRARVTGLAAGAVVLALLAIVAALVGRGVGLERLLATSTADADPRLAYLPLTTRLAKDYLPLGAGFGTFDRVFRIVEPDRTLSFNYLNHAHNDALELIITGGLPAVLVVLAFLVWLGRRAVMAFGSAGGRLEGVMPARAGLVAAALLLVASLLDYPLRTPLAGSVLALATLWIAGLRPAASAAALREADLRSMPPPRVH